MEGFKITNEHTFNNCGSFDVTIDGNIYNFKWWSGGKLEGNSPKEIYDLIYKYLFD